MPRRWEIDDQVARRLAVANDPRCAGRRALGRRTGAWGAAAATIVLGVWAAWGQPGFLSPQGSVRAGLLPAGDAASPGESPMSFLSLENSRLATLAASSAVAFAAVSYSPEIDASCAQGTGSCEGDINGDGEINAIDLSYVLTNWGTCTPPPPPLSWATTLEAVPDPAVVTDVALRNAIIATNLPWRVRDNASNIEMLLVPPGTFMMGCSASDSSACQADENPVHQVTLSSAFYLGKTEVTQAQWVAEMGSNPSSFSGYADSPLRPVDTVSWNAIQPFLTQNSLRLPTDAEWEQACRAGTTTAYHGLPGYPAGTNEESRAAEIAWIASNSAGQTHVGAGKAANGYGFHDMSGNVWEWCNDRYGNFSSSAPVTDPQGPTAGSARVLRGSAFFYGPGDCRSSARHYDFPANSNNHLGFRVARNP